MMAFSTPCCRRIDPAGWRWLSALIVLIAFGSAALYAEGIHIKSAELTATDTGYVLDANYEIVLSHTLEEALLRGLPLHLVTDFELTQPRGWTFGLWSRTVAAFRQQHRLSYNALTRQYRVSFGNLHQNFDTLDEAVAVIGRVRQRPVAAKEDIDPDGVYTAAVRLRLDTSLLPKPLQINALGSRDWNLSSDWYRWTFRP
jgi:uncharacterized protein DUF4390